MTEVSRFDIAIVGAGPAGLSAAIGASAATSSIVMIDQSPAPGGQIWRRDASADDSHRRAEIEAALRRATFMGSTTVVDATTAQGRHRLLVERAGRSGTIETGTLILATGARELFLPFPGWTLPGVIGVGGLQALMKSGFDVRGKRVVVSGSGPLLVAVAAAAIRKGGDVVAVLEQAPFRKMISFGLQLALRLEVEALGYLQELGGGVLQFGRWVSAAHGAGRVEGVRVTDGEATTDIDCDVLCTGYGLVPNTELARRLGGEIGPRGIAVDGAQRTSIPGVFAAGECAGIAGQYPASFGGMVAGRIATQVEAADLMGTRQRASRWGKILDETFALRPEVLALAEPGTIVCRCEDVRLRDIDPTWSPRQAKLYARAGMGACQGRVCGAALQRMFGWPEDSVRPPLQPTAVSSLLGAS